MNNYIWLLNKKNDSSFTWPFIMSLFLHLMLFAVLVIKPVYPLTGNTERLDSIWLYFNAQSPGQAPSSSPPALEVESSMEQKTVEVSNPEAYHSPDVKAEKANIPPHQVRPGEVNMAQPQVAEDAGKATEPLTELVVVKADSKKPVNTEAESPKRPETLPVVKKEPVSVPVERAEIKHLAPAEMQNVEAPAKEKIREQVEEKIAKNVFPVISGAAKEIIAVPAKESVKAARTERPVEPRALEAGRPEVTKAARAAVIPPGNTVRRAPTSKLQQVLNPAIPAGKPSVVAATGKEAGKTNQSIINDKPDLREVFSGFGADKLVAEIKPTGTSSELKQVQDANKPGGNDNRKVASPVAKAGEKPEIKGDTGKAPEMKHPGVIEKEKVIAIPRLTGDLKLEITGSTDLKISFAYKEFLKSRRNRPMSAAEARRLVYITPRIARPKEDLLEAVMGTTGEGIYDIIVEPANGKPVKCVLQVKIYENSNRAKTKSLGARTIGEKTVIARILMPEGVFWDDDSYFSGNLEDSDSITKFNSDTGLVWKEFK